MQQLITLNDEIYDQLMEEIKNIHITRNIWLIDYEHEDVPPELIKSSIIPYSCLCDEKVWKKELPSIDLKPHQELSVNYYIDLKEQIGPKLRSLSYLDRCDFIMYDLYVSYYKHCDMISRFNILSQPFTLPRLFSNIQTLQIIDLHGVDLSFGYELFKDCKSLRVIRLIDCNIELHNPIRKPNILDPFMPKDGIHYGVYEYLSPKHPITITTDYECCNYQEMHIFDGCDNIEEIDLTGSFIGDFAPERFVELFSNLQSLKTVCLKNAELESGHRMFANCPKLEYADLSGAKIFCTMDSGKGFNYLTDTQGMFENCSSLKHVNLDGFEIRVLIGDEILYDVDLCMKDMFKNCTSIEQLDLSKIKIMVNDDAYGLEDEPIYDEDSIAYVGNAFMTGNPNTVIISNFRINMEP